MSRARIWLLGLCASVAVAAALVLVRPEAPVAPPVHATPSVPAEVPEEAPVPAPLQIDPADLDAEGRMPRELAILGKAEPRATTDLCKTMSRPDLVERSAPGEVFVGHEAWERRTTSARVGLASWMSKCLQEGGPVRIRATGSGRLLATYDPSSGYALGDPS